MEKLPRVKEEDINIGCYTCSTVSSKANLHMPICVGFGEAYVTKDGVRYYDGELDCNKGNQPKTLYEIELEAKNYPDADWQLVMYSPCTEKYINGKEKVSGLWLKVTKALLRAI